MKPKLPELSEEPRFSETVGRLLNPAVARVQKAAGKGVVPSAQAVAAISEDLRAVLLGGAESVGDLEPRSQRCGRLALQLETEIRKGLEWGDSPSNARRIVWDLFDALPSIQNTLYEDAEASLDGDPAAQSLMEVVLAYPSLRALAVHRVANFLYQKRVPLIPRIMSEHVHGQTGIDIHPGARIGPGLFIDHGTGVVIGETAVIGRRCKLYQGVTLGSISTQKLGKGGWNPPQRHPTLEDEVTVYAHTTILGGRTVVGTGSVIGGNVWLTQSVPPYTKVQMDPPNLLYRSDSNRPPVKAAIDYQI